MSVSRAQDRKRREDETHLVAVSSSGTSETGLGSLGALSAANTNEEISFLNGEGQGIEGRKKTHERWPSSLHRWQVLGLGGWSQSRETCPSWPHW
jgi:hypothetical protein